LAVLYNYIQAENTALKLQLASLQCPVNEILTEIRKPTTTTVLQTEKVPDATPAPPSQQQTEKRKRTGPGSPTLCPPKTVRAVSPTPPSPGPATTSDPDTDMQLVLAAEVDPAIIASDGFSDLIRKRALRKRRQSREEGGGTGGVTSGEDNIYLLA
jgi:hypothetical protein